MTCWSSLHLTALYLELQCYFTTNKKLQGNFVIKAVLQYNFPQYETFLI